MNTDSDIIPATFNPGNEPYLGRQSVFHFDQTILAYFEKDAEVAEFTKSNELSDLQQAACQIIPQGVSIALSIRELVRQGYLLGAVVLMRPLIERAAIISYLRAYPKKVEIWKSGWKYGKRPKLNDMLQTMSGGKADKNMAKQVLDVFNHVIHGDPLGSHFNLVNLDGQNMGYAVSKMLDNPELCDEICFQSYCYLIVLTAMRDEIFADAF